MYEIMLLYEKGFDIYIRKYVVCEIQMRSYLCVEQSTLYLIDHYQIYIVCSSCRSLSTESTVVWWVILLIVVDTDALEDWFFDSYNSIFCSTYLILFVISSVFPLIVVLIFAFGTNFFQYQWQKYIDITT